MHREELHFWIDGMHCVNCQTRIQRMLEETPGVLHARVSYDRGDATLTCDTDVFSDEQLRRGLEQLGYAVRTERRSAEWLRALGYLSLIAALYALLEMTGALNLLAPGQLAQANMSYGMLFMVGLMTSIHCVAMCGGTAAEHSHCAEARALLQCGADCFLHAHGRYSGLLRHAFWFGIEYFVVCAASGRFEAACRVGDGLHGTQFAGAVSRAEALSLSTAISLAEATRPWPTGGRVAEWLDALRTIAGHAAGGAGFRQPAARGLCHAGV